MGKDPDAWIAAKLATRAAALVRHDSGPEWGEGWKGRQQLLPCANFTHQRAKQSG